MGALMLPTVTCFAVESCSPEHVRLLGMFVMISGNNLLVIYMGIELLTLSSYAWLRCAVTTRLPLKLP
jgi:hypothetical protein